MSEGDGKAGGGGAAAKPALSSRLLGLKFMQRSREKEQRAAAEEAAEERDAEAHWVVEGARTRCVVLAEGDPPPCSSGALGRLSFGGFNRSTEAGAATAAAGEAAAAAEAEAPDGKVVSDEAMAASLARGKGGKRRKGEGGREERGGGGKKQRRHGGDDRERPGGGGGDGKKGGGRQKARYFD